VSRVKPENWLPNGLVKSHMPRPKGLIEVENVYDIGAGIRPIQWYRPTRHLCIEPCKQYAEKLALAGYEVVQQTGYEFLRHAEPVEAIYMLDVIEHMEKTEGFETLRLARKKASKQLIVFTPYGYMEQTDDGWGLGEHVWQTHRSGWMPSDFPDYHTWRHARGFFAVLTV
jgi:hypothetical protein